MIGRERFDRTIHGRTYPARTALNLFNGRRQLLKEQNCAFGGQDWLLLGDSVDFAEGSLMRRIGVLDFQLKALRRKRGANCHLYAVAMNRKSPLKLSCLCSSRPAEHSLDSCGLFVDLSELWINDLYCFASNFPCRLWWCWGDK